MWIPAENECLQARLIVSTHMGSRRDRGKVSTPHAFRPYCMWDLMEVDVGEYVQRCLHCVGRKAEELKLRPLGGDGTR